MASVPSVPMFSRKTPINRRAALRIAVAASITLLSSTTVAAPAGLADPGSRQAELKAEVQRLSLSLQDSRSRLDVARNRALSAAAAQASLASEIASGRSWLAELGRRVDLNRSRARAATRSLERARASLARRMVEIYMAGSPQVGDLLLATGDYGQIASQGAYIEAIRDSDRALAERVAELRLARIEALEAADADRVEMASRLERLKVEMSEAAVIRAAAESSAARLDTIEDERVREIDRLRERVDRIESSPAPGSRPAEPSFPGGPYSIPTYIVMCESGGNYSALNPSSGAGGAYQIIPSTWEAYGGKGLPHLASKAEQDRIAALIWANDGPGAWVCA